MFDPNAAVLERSIAQETRPAFNPQERPDANAVAWNPRTGKLKYDSAIQLIRSGQSITNNGRLIERIEQMPSRMAWADTEEDRKEAQALLDKAVFDLQKQQEEATALQKQNLDFIANQQRDPSWTDAEWEAFQNAGKKPEPQPTKTNKK